MHEIDHITSPETGSKVSGKTIAAGKGKKSPVENQPIETRVDFGAKEVVRGWKKLKQQMEQDLLLFKITQEMTVKMEWLNLPENIKTAFSEVFTTVKNKGESADAETDGECFVFGFSDETVQVSAVCTTLNGKVAFFYKEESIA